MNQTDIIKQIDKAIQRARPTPDSGEALFRDLNELVDYTESYLLWEGQYLIPMPAGLKEKALEYERRMEVYKNRIKGKELSKKQLDAMLYGAS